MFPLFLLIVTLVPVGHVNDFAHLLKPETTSNLEAILSNFQRETGNEIAVVTIDTHGPDETIESYAVKLFEKWGIGKEKEDNGLLLLVAKDDREMRIEVGYGLEPVITDIESGRIIREILTPAFQVGDYDTGITAAAARLMSDIGNGSATSTPKDSSKSMRILFIVLFVIIWFLLARRGIWIIGGIGRGGGNNKGGGFGGFGGGMSGGGGASGRW